MNGIINFLKPAGMTSHDAIYFFRRLTGIKKIGHTGTLDPMATGVLPICIGKTTRLIEYLEEDKSYRAIMKLGIKSDTGDIWGEPLEYTDVLEYPKSKDIIKCLQSFEGDISQTVPGYSAQKHNGKKLYQYARAGEEIPVKKKNVHINNVTVISINSNNNEIMFDVSCSKGTYIRTICIDAGDKLGTDAVMSFLLRTSAGSLEIENTVTIEELEEEMAKNGNIAKYFIEPSELLKSMKKVILSKEDAKRFTNGLAIHIEIENDTEYAVFMGCHTDNDKLLGIGISQNDKLKPRKVIFSEL